MYNRNTLIVALLLLSSSTLPMISAEITSNEYMGAYFDYAATATEKVLFGCDFVNADSTAYDSGDWVAAVMSIAGGSGTTPDTYIYQTGFAHYDDDEVYFSPQYYYQNMQDPHYDSQYAGEGDYFKFYSRIERDDANDRNYFKAWIYETEWAHEHDIYTYKSKYWASPGTTDNYIIGDPSIGAAHMELFQIGIEGLVDETNWRIRTDSMCYHDGSSWKYKPGKAIRGATNLISYEIVGETLYAWPVCGDTYTNVEKYTSGSGYCEWEYDSSTQTDHSTLWSTSGTMYANVYSPWN